MVMNATSHMKLKNDTITKISTALTDGLSTLQQQLRSIKTKDEDWLIVECPTLNRIYKQAVHLKSDGLCLWANDPTADDLARCEDPIPPCPTAQEELPYPVKKSKKCQERDDARWSDADENWYLEKFPFKREHFDELEKSDDFLNSNDDPTANGKL
ncbi:Hypothetical protein NTJ_00271 [Nesidiocoris tenuis]|uniref:Uncharacterized protein n=1 Tax=Nesidiocoris tenuis TaxID=355587 RepID=A0ABN7A9A7_9HEMI|nr:Hypothetical protein NTJ_00271 [Nesidiocoris tenuis]